jgi:hypothetical protein
VLPALVVAGVLAVAAALGAEVTAAPEAALTGAPAAAVVAAEGCALTAWVSACSRLAKMVMPWSLPSLEESLPPPPPPSWRRGPWVVPKIAARLVWLEAEMGLVDIISSA